MASISTQIEIVDRISSPVRACISAVEQMIGALESVDTATGAGFDTSAINKARSAIDLANAELDTTLDAITQNTTAQQKYNTSVQEGTAALGGMADQVVAMAAAYASIQGIQELAELSDTLASSSARLELIVDDGGSVSALESEIWASAQRSRAAYTDTLSTVSKLGILAGDAFSGTDEIIAFTELMNKNFVVGGSSASEQAAAMYQLTQAMSSGLLQGDEYKSIIENAPLLAESLEDYMTNVQGVEGSLKDWASEGLLTADVIKAAVFSSADDIDARFESMPMTWAQVWTEICNRMILLGQPLLDFINLLANHWSILEPIVLGVATAMGLYLVALAIHKGIALASAVATMAHSVTTVAASVAAMKAATTQAAFNAALLACPITWIVVGIIAIIAVLYAVVAAVNYFADTSISATGIICGALAVAGAFIWNLILGVVNAVISIGIELYNLIATFANFFANVFNDPVGAIITLFSGMFDFILGIVQAAASLIDTVLGTDMASAVEGFRNTVADATAEIVGEQTVVMGKLSASDYRFDGIDYGDAWDAGYNFGEGVVDTVSGAFDSTSGYDTSSWESILADISTDTSDLSDTVSASAEELEYLRELAARESINRFTTAEINVDMGGITNQVSSNADLDGIVSYLVSGVNEAMAKSAEGVHI